jgi:UDP-3-O-[3-hydroxymyristoyl] glucosamine N-acyltransferase
MFPHGFTYNRFESKTFESDAFRWQNPDGGEGGIIADSARIDPSVFVAREAEVWPRASVGAATKIRRGARVGLDCFVSMEVEIGEFVDIYFASYIHSQARLEAGATICGGACIGNGAVLGTKAEVLGGAAVGHGARFGAGAIVGRDARIGACAVIGPARGCPAGRANRAERLLRSWRLAAVGLQLWASPAARDGRMVGSAWASLLGRCARVRSARRR